MESMCFERFCGQIVKNPQLKEIIEIIETFPKLSRTELASTVCELFSWKRPTGKLKSVECRQFLERLDEKGIINLPACRKQYANRGPAKVPRTENADIQPTISAKLKELSPQVLIRVETREQRQLWYEYVDRSFGWTPRWKWAIIIKVAFYRMYSGRCLPDEPLTD